MFSIREAAILNLKKLTERFKSDWAKTVIIPKILDSIHQSSYLYRMTAVHAIGVRKSYLFMILKALSPVLTPEVVRDQLLPALIQLQSDPIPNIRFNVAKSLEVIIPLLKAADQKVIVNEKIKPSLSKLHEDLDGDVRYYAQRALLAI